MYSESSTCEPSHCELSEMQAYTHRSNRASEGLTVTVALDTGCGIWRACVALVWKTSATCLCSSRGLVGVHVGFPGQRRARWEQCLEDALWLSLDQTPARGHFPGCWRPTAEAWGQCTWR